jgi:hypothetical protein
MRTVESAETGNIKLSDTKYMMQFPMRIILPIVPLDHCMKTFQDIVNRDIEWNNQQLGMRSNFR